MEPVRVKNQAFLDSNIKSKHITSSEKTSKALLN